MSWVVIFLNDKVVAEIESLPKDMKAKFERIVHLIESHGLQEVGMPYVRHLQDKRK